MLEQVDNVTALLPSLQGIVPAYMSGLEDYVRQVEICLQWGDAVFFIHFFEYGVFVWVKIP